MSQENLSQQDLPLQGRRIHPALHFEEDFASVGIVDFEGKYWIITSDRQLIQTDEQGVQFEVTPVPYPGIRYRWNVPDLNEFIETGTVPSFGEVVVAIRDNLTHYCDFQYGAEATVIACWIVGTYFHQLFLTFPRLFLNGERGTGKSKVLGLCAAIAFNGLLRLNSTPATLFRLIHPVRPTLCLDEAEYLSPDVESIVNAGYKREGAVDRCVGDQYEVRSFAVYCPLALGCIAGLNRTTEDRCITILMVSGRDPDKLNREMDPKDSVFSELRSRCYRLALARFKELRQMNQELALPEWLKGRHRELWRPLLAVAAVADHDSDFELTEDLLAVAQYELAQRKGGDLESESVLKILQGKLGQHQEIIVRPLWLANTLSYTLDSKISPEKAGRILKRLGFPKNRDAEGTLYSVTQERFAELWEGPV